VNPVPVITTLLPPSVEPLVGFKPVTVGTAAKAGLAWAAKIAVIKTARRTPILGKVNLSAMGYCSWTRMARRTRRT
jgi:hypothetical protein